jgi:hypothetical protein
MKSLQRGATLIEFALVSVLFFMFLLGVIDFGRMLFTWSAATEATRVGARYAVVCDDGMRYAAVLQRMQQRLPQITSASVQWLPDGCSSSNCEGVAVSITGLDYQWLAPIPDAARPLIPMPSFRTYLTREVMRQDPNSPAICS